VVGNYPKLPSAKGDLNIRKLLHRFDKQEIDRAELERGFDDVTARVLREQKAAGIDLPTDGQIRWDDIVSPFATKMAGFASGGLLRWFDNNVYYRRPRVVGKVGWQEPIAVDNYLKARAVFGGEVKVVLPAPASFALLVEDQHYGDPAGLIDALAGALRAEVEALLRAGAKVIQFDDPCIPYHPALAKKSIEVLNSVIAGQAAEFWVCYYFGNMSGIIQELPKFDGQVIAVDCVSHAGNFDTLLNLDSTHQRCFGIIEARNVKLEKPAELLPKTQRIAERFKEAYISPSCGLEFLPHRDALAKLGILGETARLANGGQKHA
jgi:5-methyltetrahydropteroyltriglutamate--homocysteine methyltransferase